MRTDCIAQGTLLNALWWPKGEENPQKEGICVYTSLIHFAVQQKVTQHCKAAILQFKKEEECCFWTSIFLRLCRQARKNWVAHIIRSCVPHHCLVSLANHTKKRGPGFPLSQPRENLLWGQNRLIGHPQGSRPWRHHPKAHRLYWTSQWLWASRSSSQRCGETGIIQGLPQWLSPLKQGSLLAQKTQYISDNIISVQ